MTTYSEKLKDPRWQKKRLEVLERDNFTCTECSDTENTLNVHHLIYYSHNPWETDDRYLRTLCDKCHKKYPSDIRDTIGDLLGGHELTLKEFNIIYGSYFSILLATVGKNKFIKLHKIFFNNLNSQTSLMLDFFNSIIKEHESDTNAVV